MASSASVYFDERLQTGAAAGTACVAREGRAANHTVLTLTATPVTITKASSDGYGSVKIYDFPVGLLQILSLTANFTATAAAGISATGDLIASVGTTATANSTLATTEIDLAPAETVTLIASVGTFALDMTLSEMSGALFNGTTTAKDLILNFALAAGVSSSSSLAITGTVSVTWINHGNFQGVA